MNNEIKEILDNFKIYEDRYKKCNETQFIIFYRDIHLLLDYITNLQEENTKLKELCDKYEEEHNNAFKLWTMKMEEMPDYEERMNYKSRIKKIINKISLYRMDDITMETNRILDDLLNTARGVDKE